MKLSNHQFLALFYAVSNHYEASLAAEGVPVPGVSRIRYGQEQYWDHPASLTQRIFADQARFNKNVPRVYLQGNFQKVKNGETEISIPEVHVEAFLQYLGKTAYELDPDLFPMEDFQEETTTYRVFFYSFVRFNIWDRGRLTLTRKRQGTLASAKGFYQDAALMCYGELERTGSSIFINMSTHKGKESANRLKIAAEVNDATFSRIFRGTIVTKSSHGAYTAATEAVFVNEAFYDPDRDEQSIRRYLMLRRNRFEVSLTGHSSAADMGVGPGERIMPRRLETMVGCYRLEAVMAGLFIVGKLRIFDDYRAYLCCALDLTNAHSHMNNQVVCIEMGEPLGRLFLLLKGYIGNVWNEANPIDDYRAELRDQMTTMHLAVPQQREKVIREGFMTTILRDQDYTERVLGGAVSLIRMELEEFEKMQVSTTPVGDSKSPVG